MKVRELAVRNGLWNALATAFSGATGLIASVLVVRSLAPDEYGVFSYYLWLSSIAVALATLAFPVSLTKITSELVGRGEEDEASALSTLVVLGVLALSLLMAGGILLWALAASDRQQVYLLIIAGALVPNCLAPTLLSVLWGRQRYKPVAIMLLLASTTQLGLVFLTFREGWGTTGFVIAVLSASVVNTVGLSAILARSSDAIQHSWTMFRLPRRATLRRYGAFVVPATLSQVFTVIVWERSEIFFLERFSSYEAVGIYGIAYTMASLSMVLGWALVNGFHPAISEDYGAGEWGRIREKVRQGVILAALYATPVTFGSWATLSGLFVLVYGTKTLPSVPVAYILFAGLLPGVLGSMLGIMVSAVGGIWLHVRLGLVLSIVNIILALVLIPRADAVGAAIANTGSQVIHVALLLFFVRRIYKISLPWSALGRIGLLGFVTTYLLPRGVQEIVPGVTGLLLALAAAGSAYAIAMWYAGYLRILMPMLPLARDRSAIAVSGDAGTPV
jgi:O-antigen/teichoic acid export membrane protein